MKKTAFLLAILVIFCSVPFLAAQNKYALVIGNGAYTGISRLNNPVNDANDMEAALRRLGFTVVKVLDGSLDQMEDAVMDLSRRLSADSGSYGVFYYAGHGVQANGENYLLPVNVSNIQNESLLRQRAVSLDFVMETLGDAGNMLNMVVLDACRDNPFAWARGGSRGLTVISGASSGSIIMYAASANAAADDNNAGRNSLFTGRLLANMGTEGLSVLEVFERTMGDVINATGGRQHPELSIRFAGASSTYLGSRPAPRSVAEPQPAEPEASSSKYYINLGFIGYGGMADYGGGSSGSVSIEYHLSNGLSLGAFIGRIEVDDDIYISDVTTVNAKAAWNWNVNQKLLPYAGLLLGFSVEGYHEEKRSSYSVTGTTNNAIDQRLPLFVSFGLNLGTRFFFNKYIGICFDSFVCVGPGNGALFGGANIGLAVKF